MSEPRGDGGERLRALVVDADADFARQAATLLRDAGLYVSEARSGARAVELLEREPYDVCVVDLHLPDVPALELRACSRRCQRSPAFVVTSAFAKAGAGSLRAGADDFIYKPPAPEVLLERVCAAAQRRRHLCALEERLAARENPAQLQGGTPRVHVTAVFTDVRGFTKISEATDPETALALLNGLFVELVDAVQHYHGHVDNFMGDGMMAIFHDGAAAEGRAPRTMGHPLRALMAAHRMQKRVRGFHETSPLAAQHELTIGVGVHTGDAVYGPVGAGALRKVTVIGDSVNVAARLCELARGDGIMLSEATLQATSQHAVVEDSWEVTLRGRREPLLVHQVRLRLNE